MNFSPRLTYGTIPISASPQPSFNFITHANGMKRDFGRTECAIFATNNDDLMNGR